MMSRITNFKSIRMKILSGFSIVILLVVILGVYNFFVTKESNKNIESMLNNEVQLLIANDKLVSTIANRIGTARGYVLFGGDFKDRFNEYTEQGIQAEKIIREIEVTEEFDTLMNRTVEWRKSIASEVFNEYDKGNKDLALKNLEKLTPEARELMIGYEKLASESEQKLTELGNDTILNGNRSLNVTSVITALIIGLSIIVGIVTSHFISKPIKMVVERMKQIANGDLRHEPLKTKSIDEIGQLVHSVNSTNESLLTIVKDMINVSGSVKNRGEQLTQYSDELLAGSQQIATTMEELSAGAEEQAHSSATLNENMGNFSQQIMDVALKGESVKEQSDTMLQLTENGSHYMEESVQKMATINGKMKQSLLMVKGLDNKTDNISNLVNVIKDIAAQTNLLALNAAIEAARAGEQGRGFAVVATEVQKLAEQVSESVTDITSIVTDIQDESKQVVESLDEGYKLVDEGTNQIKTTGDTFTNLKEAIETVGVQIRSMSSSLYDVLDNTKTINSAIENIASVSEESAAGVEQVSATTQQASTSMEEVSESAKSLEENANTLDALIQRFKVN
ncbi:methyl-accepting chemotaxis protein [Lederbergia graminis]|uniref:Methyl-accepting chemotaxis protein n=1 Tax=Lederbergia graminis TaxID=735518 RepID=A0ABW0LE71_9BACI